MELNESRLNAIKLLFGSLLETGDPSVITDMNVAALNEITMRLYEQPTLDVYGVECLKYVIMICNVLYNRTDMDKLPIEDGFYDLLLEKYKTYDANFQVGSAVVEMRSTRREPGKEEPQSPIIFYDKREIPNETAQFVHDQIMRTGQPIMNFVDLNKCPITFNNQTISKRTHTTEHSHPSLVGTLDKCKFVLVDDAIRMGAIDDPNVKILERDFFMKHIQAGIINPNQKIEVVLELKYDGISVEADCTNTVISARTRGDTGIGQAADISPILAGYLFKHAKDLENIDRTIGVKFEAIMTKSSLYYFNIARNNNYANCRTAIIGLFGASDVYLFRDHITLIPLAVDRNDVPQIKTRLDEIKFINEVYRSNGEPLRYCVIQGTVPELLYTIKMFLEEAKAARDYLNFMYDGIVVSYNDPDICERLGRENYINKYSMAVKFDPMSKQTIFRGYTYEVGQHGKITPMLHYDPVEFYGTIHTKCSGASLERFQELSLKYGDLIELTYVNDVMPYPNKLDCEHNRCNTNPVIEPPTTCPSCGEPLEVSSTGKNLLCINRYCPARQIVRMTNMLEKMNLKGFGESSMKSLGAYHLKDIVNLDEEFLISRLGEADGRSFAELMNKFKTEPIYDYIVMGSLGFTGIARKKWQIVLNSITLKDLVEAYQHDALNEALMVCKGVGPVMRDTIVSEFEFFYEDILFIVAMLNLINSKGMEARKVIRFTGCRDSQLEEQLCNAGYDADSSSSVSAKTNILLVPYEGYESSKTKRAVNAKIIPIEDFRGNMDFYLS